MSKIKKLIISESILILAGVWGEVLLCLVRSYAELSLSIVCVGIVCSVLSIIAFVTEKNFLNFTATILMLVGSVLLIVFPSYFPYVAMIFGIPAFVCEISASCLFFIAKVKQNRN